MGAMMNEDRFGVLTLSLNIASVGAGSGSEQTFTLTGAKVGDFVAISKPTIHAGLGVVNARIPAKDQIAIQFINATGSPIVPGVETYQVLWFRAEKVSKAISI